MNIIGLIPSRMSSSRFPGKPLAMISGVPMINRVYENALRSKLIDELMVITPDLEITEHCHNAHIGCALVPDCPPCNTGTERCSRFFEIYLQGPQKWDLIINIQGDEPLMDSSGIDNLIRVMIEEKEPQVGSLYRRAMNLSELYKNSRVKIVLGKDDKYAMSFYRQYPSVNIHSYIHQGIYIFRQKALDKISHEIPNTDMEQLGWGYPIRMVNSECQSIAIDTPEDILEAEQMIKERGLS